MNVTEIEQKQTSRSRWTWTSGFLAFVILLGAIAMPFVQNYRAIMHFKRLPSAVCITESKSFFASFLASLQKARETYFRKRFSDAPLLPFETVTYLEANEATIRDRDLSYLRGFKDLENLDLNNTQITNAGLIHLKELPKLRVLRLRKTVVDHEGLVQLKELSNLHEIWISSTHMTKAGLGQIKEALPDCQINLVSDTPAKSK